jgi:hypothetical protein
MLNKIIGTLVVIVFSSICISCNKCKNHIGSENHFVYNNTDSIITISKDTISNVLTHLQPYTLCNIHYFYTDKLYFFKLPSGRKEIDTLYNNNYDNYDIIWSSRNAQYVKVNDRGCEFYDIEYLFTINQKNVDNMK